MSANIGQRIARHQGSPGRPEEEELAFEDHLIAIKQDQIDEDVEDLPQLIRAPFKGAGLLQALHPDDSKLTFYLRLGARVTLAACRLAEPGDGPLTVDFGLGRTHVLPRTADPLVDPIDLQRGLFAAMAVRDAETAEALARIDLALLKPQGVVVDSWAIDWAHAVQGFVLDVPWVNEVFQRAMLGADPAQYRKGSVAYVGCALLTNPLMNLCLATGQTPVEFNSELRKALEAHWAYYGLTFDPPRNQQNDPEGFLALGPLAFAVTMHDKGWPITVESDYLPRSLVDSPKA